MLLPPEPFRIVEVPVNPSCPCSLALQGFFHLFHGQDQCDLGLADSSCGSRSLWQKGTDALSSLGMFCFLQLWRHWEHCGCNSAPDKQLENQLAHMWLGLIIPPDERSGGWLLFNKLLISNSRSHCLMLVLSSATFPY